MSVDLDYNIRPATGHPSRDMTQGDLEVDVLNSPYELLSPITKGLRSTNSEAFWKILIIDPHIVRL